MYSLWEMVIFSEGELPQPFILIGRFDDIESLLKEKEIQIKKGILVMITDNNGKEIKLD